MFSVAEYDTPHVLLQNPDSFFLHLVSELPTRVQRELQKVARDHYLETHWVVTEV